MFIVPLNIWAREEAPAHIQVAVADIHLVEVVHKERALEVVDCNLHTVVHNLAGRS